MRQATLALALFLFSILSACSTPAAPAPATASTPGAQPAAQPSADYAVNGRILFVKDGLIQSWNGGAVRKLTGEGSAYEAPAWSPDGRRIAATIAGQNHSDIVLLNSDGKVEKQLTRNLSTASVQDSRWARRPAWSPDGVQLAYATDRGSYRLGLWIIDVNSGTPRRANYRALGDGDVDSPSWSKDGKRLAFVAFWEDSSQIYVLDLGTGAVKRLTNHKEGVYDAAWSPDGNKIAYVKRAAGRHDIWVIDPDGTGDSRVTNLGKARSPAWSPDGQIIAFVADQGQGFDLHVTKIVAGSGGSVTATSAKPLTRGQRIDATTGVSWSK